MELVVSIVGVIVSAVATILALRPYSVLAKWQAVIVASESAVLLASLVLLGLWAIPTLLIAFILAAWLLNRRLRHLVRNELAAAALSTGIDAGKVPALWDELRRVPLISKVLGEYVLARVIKALAERQRSADEIRLMVGPITQLGGLGAAGGDMEAAAKAFDGALSGRNMPASESVTLLREVEGEVRGSRLGIDDVLSRWNDDDPS